MIYIDGRYYNPNHIVSYSTKMKLSHGDTVTVIDIQTTTTTSRIHEISNRRDAKRIIRELNGCFKSDVDMVIINDVRISKDEIASYSKCDIASSKYDINNVVIFYKDNTSQTIKCDDVNHQSSVIERLDRVFNIDIIQ